MVTLATTTYGYDDRNQLTSVGSATFIYDYAGRRTQMDDGVLTTDYLWDEFSRYGDVVQESNATDTTAYTLANGQLISQTNNTGTDYFLQDALGSTRALTNSAGIVADTFDYDAFGNLLGNPASLATNYLYTGQQYDELTELYSLRARYYAPNIGRFLSRDTWPYDYDTPIELNRYVYTANNPVNYIDGELIETTPEHPFYTDDGEWVEAADGSVGALEGIPDKLLEFFDGK